MNTVTSESIEYNKYIDLIREMTQTIPDDKLRENYRFDTLKLEEWIAASYYDGGFSSVAWRPIWGNNCRILNRFYKKPEARFENKKRRVSDVTLNMIEQQLAVAKDLGFDCAFMSRETRHQAFNHYKKHLPQTWTTPDEKYLMWKQNTTVYQNIMWTPVNSSILTMEREDGSYGQL